MRDFLTGARLFGQGAVLLLRSPKLLLIGALPAVLTSLLLLGGLVALVFFVDDLAALVTPFADDWAAGLRSAVRVAAGVALFAAALVIGLISFSALTLAIGGPFYESIAEQVEEMIGSPPGGTELSGGRLLWLGLRDGVLLVLRSLVFTIPLLVAGFVPVLGQTVVPVLLALVTAWFLTLELVAVTCYRHGLDLRQRRKLMARRRALALGFGLPASLLCAIPLVAIVALPVAFAGGVLVAHRALPASADAR